MRLFNKKAKDFIKVPVNLDIHLLRIRLGGNEELELQSMDIKRIEATAKAVIDGVYNKNIFRFTFEDKIIWINPIYFVSMVQDKTKGGRN